MSYHESDYYQVQKLQEEISKKVIAKDQFSEPIRNVCGVDVSYRKDVAYCSAVVVKKDSMQVLESVNLTCKVNQPYVPGLFLLREYKPIIDTVHLLKEHFDLLLVDGHGQLHPRKCGLACSIGVTLDKPTIGVAKSLLCGSVQNDDYIELDGQILGAMIKIKSKKSLYISVGHKVSLKTSEKIVRDLIKNDESIPMPLLVAHINSKRLTTEGIAQNSR
ncbi:MAG: endonuclease V [Nitrosopumilaceae archaeon]